MMSYLYDLSPALSAAVASAAMWGWRNQARKDGEARAKQLQEAAALLDAHANSMARFLEANAPDAELKRLVISFSDAMADREVVAKLAAWASSRQFQENSDNSLPDVLTSLRATEPDLADEFRTAIMTAAMGACLRWPESAALFEQAFAKLAAVPKSDVAIAVTASGLRERVPFSVRPHAAAMA